MRAVLFSEFGGPEVLRVVDVPEPTVAADAVLVELAAAGINPADSKRRSGATPIPTLPSGTGREFAGSVIAVGAGVTEFEIGDTVYGTGEGVISERVAAPAAMLTHVPYGLDRITASTIPVAAQTAAVAVASQQLTRDDTVLISAAAGGVGHIAVQLAARTGARVIGTASERNADLVRGWGAEPVPYGPGLTDRLREMAPSGLTAVLDHHGADTVETALALGVPADRINSIAGVAERFGVRHVGRVGLDRTVVDRLARDVTNGRLEIRIVETFRLDRVVEAYRTLDAGHVAGKLVITF